MQSGGQSNARTIAPLTPEGLAPLGGCPRLAARAAGMPVSNRTGHAARVVACQSFLSSLPELSLPEFGGEKVGRGAAGGGGV
jgi:hypothetical protein